MNKCKKCGVIRSSSKLFDGFCNRCKSENKSNNEEEDYESFMCEDCDKMSPINLEREEEDFCKYCNKGLCPSCRKKHLEVKNPEICAFLHENFPE